jgi:hypothetical protein
MTNNIGANQNFLRAFKKRNNSLRNDKIKS